MGITGPVVLGGLAFFAFYIRRQRNILREVGEMLADYSETAT